MAQEKDKSIRQRYELAVKKKQGVCFINDLFLFHSFQFLLNFCIKTKTKFQSANEIKI